MWRTRAPAFGDLPTSNGPAGGGETVRMSFPTGRGVLVGTAAAIVLAGAALVGRPIVLIALVGRVEVVVSALLGPRSYGLVRVGVVLALVVLITDLLAVVGVMGGDDILVVALVPVVFVGLDGPGGLIRMVRVERPGTWGLRNLPFDDMTTRALAAEMPGRRSGRTGDRRRRRTGDRH